MLFPALQIIDDTEPHPACLNMAIDEVLLGKITAPTLRFYRWAEPAVSFGYFTPLAEVVRAWPERVLVRRWTGGGIVPHGDDFTYTLICPIDAALAALPPLESYQAIHGAVAQALAKHRPEIILAGSAAPKVSHACFENPAQFDILAGAEKVAGAAQRRTRKGLLHQGSIQIPGLNSHFARSLVARLSPHADWKELPHEALAIAVDLAASRYASEQWLRRV